MTRFGIGSLMLVAAVALYVLTQPQTPQKTESASMNLQEGEAMVAVRLPAAFTEQEQMGQRAYEVFCAECHGPSAQGRQGIAPPLVHKIYEPGHHGDGAFVVAVQNGVRAHHWRFGDMPRVAGVTRAEVLDIVAYVRTLQRENGIN
jgi:mono/diheme cytochrome c family protein